MNERLDPAINLAQEKQGMSYTRELEVEFFRTEKILNDAKNRHDIVRIARNEHKNRLGQLLLACPMGAGTHGAAEWAIRNANTLVELLAPFIPRSGS